jgi:GNAT superfamily N-acetyltransferase
MELFQVTVSTGPIEFTCGDEDLDDFIINDACDYHTNLLSETFILKTSDVNLGYFTLLNDKVGLEAFDDRTSFNRFRKKRFVNSKRLKAYPAIKIGRLAVHQDYSRNGYGSLLLDTIKTLIISNRYSGCRFMTVDAYKDVIPFYEKNGFIRINSSIADNGTCLMVYDLISATA